MSTPPKERPPNERHPGKARARRTPRHAARPSRVLSVAKETHDTFTLKIEPPEPDPVAFFQPGQFSMLYVPGVGELPISISGDPERRETLTYTIRSVGQVTYQLVTRSPGDSIGIRGPFGTSWPLKEARGKSVLRRGGIGLAPLRPAIYHVLRHRGDYNRLVILYGGRSPRDLLYKKEFAAWGMLPDTQALATVDYGGVSWRGYVGVVTTLFRHVRMQPDETVAMLCGPEIMMRYASRELESRRPHLPNLALHGTQHEVRRRLLRPLPARPLLRLQRRPRLLSPHAQASPGPL